MAGTIVMSLTCAIENGTFTDNPNIPTTTIVQTAVGGGNPGTVSVTTSEADITIGLTTPWMCVIENLDDTNYVQIGPKSGGAMVPLLKLKPGTWAIVPLDASVTLRAKANTATCKIRIRAYED